MQTRPTRQAPMTSKQAKAAFNKYGPRISSQEKRRNDREIELWDRAQKIKDKEARKKTNKRKREEKEAKSREERRRLNIASQKPYVSPHQTRLFGFFGKPRGNADESVPKVEDELDQANLSLGSVSSPLEAKERNHEDIDTLLEGADFPSSDFEDEHNDGSRKDLVQTPPPVSTDDQPACHTDRDEPPVDDKTTPGSMVQASLLVIPNESPASDSSPGSTAWDSNHLEHIWDDLVVSNTQISRELDSDTISRPISPLAKPTRDDPELAFVMSTQDVSFSSQDLEELGVMSPASSVAKAHQGQTAIAPAPQPKTSRQALVTKPPQNSLAARKPLQVISKNIMPVSAPAFQKPALLPPSVRQTSYAVNQTSPAPRPPPPTFKRPKLPTPSFHRPVLFQPPRRHSMPAPGPMRPFKPPRRVMPPPIAALDFDDLLPSDFELSTQDCRELNGA